MAISAAFIERESSETTTTMISTGGNNSTHTSRATERHFDLTMAFKSSIKTHQFGSSKSVGNR